MNFHGLSQFLYLTKPTNHDRKAFTAHQVLTSHVIKHSHCFFNSPRCKKPTKKYIVSGHIQTAVQFFHLTVQCHS
ncbi:hypothetical protein RchiOBHm_Chr5g0003901 [Rosa chinensis]|uniref:Uncharacterized protein n=1 Tax=Rosa chinensis TaxID=74649 RepID=A0A2P6Q2V6_ROSCH|nr:hypothetical protein RchiOBHm_Chr5g0003901 [Rosa chinensis]